MMLYRALVNAEKWIAAAFLVIMVLLIFLGGIARLLGHPQNWTTDIATCLFAWACFLCADVAWRRNALMSIDLLTNRVPRLAQRICVGFNYLLITLFLLYVIGWGSWLAWISRQRSFQGIPEISYSWVTMSLPIGALLLLITTVLRVRDEYRTRGRRPAAHDVEDVARST